MARAKTKKQKITSKKVEVEKSSLNWFDKLPQDFKDNKSYWNLILGGLIVIVIGILLFNYFNKPQGNLGPSQQTQNQNAPTDVAKDNLPGKYSVKNGDTLFLIAQKYYDDGYQFTEIAQANKLGSVDVIEVGQVLEIPKIEAKSPSPSPVGEEPGKGGAVNQTIWGETITGGNYTVTSGDWLSKIAGRAYGDPLAYEKIAKANNIANPDLIEPGTVLKIPR